MIIEHWLFALILVVGVMGSIIARKLTLPAAACGGIVATAIYIGIGYTGIAMMTAFFLLATLATAWKLGYKQAKKLAEVNKGMRNAGQVLANAAMPALLAILAVFVPGEKNTLSVLIASAFASATGDTLSSELGNVYGRNFYNIISFKKDKRGLDGVVSLEGTFCGILGSILIAIIYCFGFGFNPNALL